VKFVSGGTPRTVEDDEREEEQRRMQEVRAARVKVARGNGCWTEIPQARLVRRGPGYLIDEETDLVYTIYRGTVWESGKATAISDRAPLAFYVTLDDRLVFLESAGSETWSERVERRERRNAGLDRRMAPRRS
jgi:hypothetical protein